MSILFPGMYRTLYGDRLAETPAAVATSNPADPAKVADPPAYVAPATQEDFDKIVADRVKRAERIAADKAKAEINVDQIKADAIEAHRKEQENKTATEQGQFKKPYEDALAEIETLKGTIATLESDAKTASLETLKAKAAAKHGLPEALAARLQGTDEATIEEDAKALAAVAKTTAAPNTEGGKGKPAGDKTSTTPPVKTPAHSFANRGIVPFPGREAATKEA